MGARAKQRFADPSLATAGGSAFAANHQVHGLDPAQAEEAAEFAGATARGEVFVPDEPKDGEKDISPPDKEAPSPEETEAARLLATLRGAQRAIEPDGIDPLIGPDAIRRLQNKLADTLEPIDVLELMFHGYVEQEVPFLANRPDFTLRMRTLKSAHYMLLDWWAFEAMDETLPIAQRRRMRHQVGAACTVLTVGGRPPALSDGTALIDVPQHDLDFSSGNKELCTKIFQQRLDWLMDKTPGAADMIAVHTTLFEQRVRRALADAAYVGQQVKKT
jgi:hypothetical protein